MSESWLDELDLDPTSSWLKMGTRSIGDRPWLLRDAKTADELAERARLLDERHDDVFFCPDSAREAAEAVLHLVEADLGERSAATALSPLEQAGRLVQEDLVLMRRHDDGWFLDAACLCFPSRWRLADKVGRPMLAVHGPVGGYDVVLEDKVNMMLDRLRSRPVWRRNWFVHPNPALFQPSPGDDQVVPADRCLDELYVRSERQTLRRLDADGWILFTIRIQHCPLRELVEVRHSDVVRFLTEAPADSITHHGITPAQATPLNEHFGVRPQAVRNR